MSIRPLFISTLLCLLFLSCQENEPVDVPAGFDWQGHRGCRGLMPENTIPAFLKALEFEELTTMELDLAVSSDGQLIVSHEPWFFYQITTLPNGDSLKRSGENDHLIHNLTAAQIRQYDVGKRPNERFKNQKLTPACKPTIQEVIDTVKAVNPERFATLQWNMEIKSKPDWDSIQTPPVRDFAQLVVDFIVANDLVTNTTVQSFDVRALQAVKELNPDIRLVFLVENIQGFDDNMEKLGFIPEIYSPAHQLVDKKLVEKCHAKGMKIIPWTINEVKSMRRLIKLGVDGIITDYPDRIQLVSEKKAEG